MSPDQTKQIAEYIEDFRIQGRHPVLPRDAAALASLESRAGTQRLATIPDEVPAAHQAQSTG
jgi:hypothetical protein